MHKIEAQQRTDVMSVRWIKRLHPHGGYDMVLEQLLPGREAGEGEWHEVPGAEE